MDSKVAIKRPFLLFEFSFVFGNVFICITPLLLLFLPDEFIDSTVFGTGQIRLVPLFESTHAYLAQNNRHLDANRFALGANIVLIVYFFQMAASFASPFFEIQKYPPAVNLTRQSVSVMVLWAIAGIAYLFFPDTSLSEGSIWRYSVLATNKRYILFACFSFPFCILLYGLSKNYLRLSKSNN